ncbi:uncharacterized protein LOC115357743 [Myripristis murdjan]|uniref:uncharacterized protein LOC115357743 n=1 Tax=Myripristis murdjan TaxID=586833 RepID=UPI001175F774|nr:uncharacterized protein LOC115357743 [Myripristis murdjan]
MNSVVVVLSLLLSRAAAASQPPLSCSGTPHPSGSASYRLSSPPPHRDCETSWEDHNEIVLARDSEFNQTLVSSLTMQSITMKTCWDVLTYREDCPSLGTSQKIRCTANCSFPPERSLTEELICLPGLLCLRQWTFGLGVASAVLVLVLVLALGFCLGKCRAARRVERSSVAYSAGEKHAELDGGQAVTWLVFSELTQVYPIWCWSSGCGSRRIHLEHKVRY